MATHSSTLAWEIPWTEEPGRLQSMGLWRVGHWETSLSLFTFMRWRRKWQPTPVFLPEAWWTAVYGVAQSRTRLKQFSSSSSSSTGIKPKRGSLKFSFVSFQSLVILTNFEIIQNWSELQFSFEKKSLPNIMCVNYTSKKKEKKEREGRKERKGRREDGRGIPWRSSGSVLVFSLPRAWVQSLVWWRN